MYTYLCVQNIYGRKTSKLHNDTSNEVSHPSQGKQVLIPHAFFTAKKKIMNLMNGLRRPPRDPGRIRDILQLTQKSALDTIFKDFWEVSCTVVAHSGKLSYEHPQAHAFCRAVNHCQAHAKPARSRQKEVAFFFEGEFHPQSCPIPFFFSSLTPSATVDHLSLVILDFSFLLLPPSYSSATVTRSQIRTRSRLGSHSHLSYTSRTPFAFCQTPPVSSLP